MHGWTVMGLVGLLLASLGPGQVRAQAPEGTPDDADAAAPERQVDAATESSDAAAESPPPAYGLRVAPVLEAEHDENDPALTTQPAPIALPAPRRGPRTRMPVLYAEHEVEQLPPITPSADIFSRYELRANVDRLSQQPAPRFGEGDRVAYRARFGLKTRPVHFGSASTLVYVEPQASGFWGQSSAGLQDASIGLHQAYMQLWSGNHRWETGRFELSYGDELVIGSVGWSETGRAFDGTRVHLQYEPGDPWLDLFITSVAEGSPQYTLNVGEGDHYFVGAYGGLGAWFDVPDLELDVYLLGDILAPTDDYVMSLPDDMTVVDDRDGAVRVTLGTRLKGRRGLFDYRAETGLQLGTALAQDAFVNRGVLAAQADAEVGVSSGGLRVSLEGLIATGDDPTTTDRDEGWAQLYPTGHKWLGLSDVFGGRNDIAGGVLHLSYGVVPGVTAKLDAHVYAKPQRDDGYSGSELDLYGLYDIGGGLVGRLLYGLTLPNKDAFGADALAVHYVEFQLRQRL